jgi:hypothetical protein
MSSSFPGLMEMKIISKYRKDLIFAKFNYPFLNECVIFSESKFSNGQVKLWTQLQVQ